MATREERCGAKGVVITALGIKGTAVLKQCSHQPPATHYSSIQKTHLACHSHAGSIHWISPFPVVTLVTLLLTVYIGDEFLHGEKAVTLLSRATQGVSLRV